MSNYLDNTSTFVSWLVCCGLAIMVSTQGGGPITLITLRGVTVQDTGPYTCEVRNKFESKM